MFISSRQIKYVEKFIDDLNNAAEFDTVKDKLYYMSIMARILHDDD